MKIELDENKVYFNSGLTKKEIHPFWLRERVDGEEFLDKGTQQRLFDPTTLSSEISINTANINEKFLEIDFNDGVKSIGIAVFLESKLKPKKVFSSII